MADAKRRVEIIVWTNRGKERPTHFISIPLIAPHIKERVAEFTSTVMESCRRVNSFCTPVLKDQPLHLCTEGLQKTLEIA